MELEQYYEVGNSKGGCNLPKPMELYLNNKTGNYYRVMNVNVLEGRVVYLGVGGKLWSRPLSKWFGKNSRGQVRFTKVDDDDKSMLWPNEA